MRGSVPVNSMVYILKGNSDRLIAAAENAGRIAAKNALKQTNDIIGLSIVLIVLAERFIGRRFFVRIGAIQGGVGKGRAIIGALSIGEIAKTSRGTINSLNKSIVIGNL